MANRILPFVLAFATTGVLAHASVYVVDDNPGPGVDFGDVASALAVTVPGDVVIVRAGTYGGFTLTRGVQVLGESSAIILGEIRVQGVSAGPRAAITRLATRSVVVSDCTATVLLEQLVVRPDGAPANSVMIAIAQSSDVRLRRIDAGGALPGSRIQVARITSARVEITHSTLVAPSGEEWTPFSSGDDDGGHGIEVLGSGELHLSRSDLAAGNGTDNWDSEWFPGGDGGTAIQVGSGASLLLTGTTSDVVSGGRRGNGSEVTPDGGSGLGIYVAPGGLARVSGATVVAEFPSNKIVGTATLPNPVDPSLAVSGITAPGNVVTYTVHGAPGGAARLRLGRQATVQDLLDTEEDRLTLPLRTFDLGTLPASGEASFSMTLPASLPAGFVVIAQASVVLPTGDVELTQSVPITLH